MCTVTIVPRESGFRIGCNRDERLSRAPAESPRWRGADPRVVYPTDPHAGGTWIGANDEGLALVLLNRTDTPRRPPKAGALSRGRIIPPLLACRTLDAAIESATRLSVRSFEPFTLVAVQRRTLASVTSDGEALACSTAGVRTPILFTSSSLGDALVEPWRRRLFERLVLESPSWLEGQRAFHDHRWADWPELSVRMLRQDARTVSRTFVDVGPDEIAVSYEPFPLSGAAA